MRLRITSVDHAPDDLAAQLPLGVELLREISSSKRAGCWLGKLSTPVAWNHGDREHSVEHVVLWPRWEGTRIEPRCRHLPVGIAYVTDASLLDDADIDSGKCEYVAIGIAHHSLFAVRGILARRR